MSQRVSIRLSACKNWTNVLVLVLFMLNLVLNMGNFLRVVYCEEAVVVICMMSILNQYSSMRAVSHKNSWSLLKSTVLPTHDSFQQPPQSRQSRSSSQSRSAVVTL